MALITCPECGKEVSDMAPACVHCGYPLGNIKVNNTKGKNTICIIEGQKYDLSKTLKAIQDNPEFCYPTVELLQKTNPIIEQISKDIVTLDYRDRFPLIRIIEKSGEVPNVYIPQYPH